MRIAAMLASIADTTRTSDRISQSSYGPGASSRESSATRAQYASLISPSVSASTRSVGTTTLSTALCSPASTARRFARCRSMSPDCARSAAMRLTTHRSAVSYSSSVSCTLSSSSSAEASTK